MSSLDAIRVEGTIIEVLPRAVFQVKLPNGHQMLGFSRRRDRDRTSRLVCGDEVTLEVSPYDFSAGRICLAEAVTDKNDELKTETL